MKVRARFFLLWLLPAQAADAAPLASLDADGWYTWRVAAVEDAPAWCCVSRLHASPASRGCNLDGRHHGYGPCDENAVTDGEVQLYARIDSGRLARLRVLSPGCPVQTEARVTDLGTVEVAESFAWLRDRVGQDADLNGDALAAIAVHDGDQPFGFLVDAANGSATGEIREDAIFWLGQVRIADSAAVIERLMFDDDSAGIRQHAAFVLGQSTFAGRHEALIRQGRGDEVAEVRSQAWFWLAQTGANGSEEAIRQAMAEDPDREVREEAVFALSQLPGERAVDALLAVVEDRRLATEVRKAALFWLVQSESDRAFASVERLLGDAR